MCGVFGYVGMQDAISMCLKGLTLLEYRGYDSTGIAAIQNGKIAFCKKQGKLADLKNVLPLFGPLSLAIAHTRWATHGKVSDQNAHPHFDSSGSIAVVHNGIIENFDQLRDELKKDGAKFVSDTDTEVVAHLLAKHYRGDLAQSLHAAIGKLKGTFALVAIHKDHPDEIAAAARDCPLAIAVNENESIVSSDPNTLIGKEFDVIFLQHGEIARIKRAKVEVFDLAWNAMQKTSTKLKGKEKGPSKEGFEHFMLKEIYEQPNRVQEALNAKFDLDLQKYSKILFLGCGTSFHAGLIGEIFFEDFANFPAIACISSEARFRTSLMTKDTLAIAISQSGETADTIAALRAVKEKGCPTIAICNVENSTLAREADRSIYLNAGPELSVCSTKAFTSQIAILSLVSPNEELKKIPFLIQTVLDSAIMIEKMAKKYSRFNNFFFMGRRYMFPTCLEAALKLKEISYVNANGYPAGELKHGPIALLDSEFPVIAFLANKLTEEKMISNLMEVKARGAPVLAIAPAHLKSVTSIADDVIWVPDSIDALAPFPSAVVGQLFAYYFAKIRGCDIDQPRNLAKSVTVE